MFDAGSTDDRQFAASTVMQVCVSGVGCNCANIFSIVDFGQQVLVEDF